MKVNMKVNIKFSEKAIVFGEAECCALANWHGREDSRLTAEQKLWMDIFDNSFKLGQIFREDEKDFYLQVALDELKYLEEKIREPWRCRRFFRFSRGLIQHGREEHISALKNICQLMTKDLPIV